MCFAGNDENTNAVMFIHWDMRSVGFTKLLKPSGFWLSIYGQETFKATGAWHI